MKIDRWKDRCMQNYYGLAVGENLDDVNKMATAIEAVVYYVASTHCSGCGEGKT